MDSVFTSPFNPNDPFVEVRCAVMVLLQGSEISFFFVLSGDFSYFLVYISIAPGHVKNKFNSITNSIRSLNPSLPHPPHTRARAQVYVRHSERHSTAIKPGGAHPRFDERFHLPVHDPVHQKARFTLFDWVSSAAALSCQSKQKTAKQPTNQSLTDNCRNENCRTR